MLYPRMTPAVPIPLHRHVDGAWSAWRVTGREGRAISTGGNDVKPFERALSEQSPHVHVLRLYVGGASPKSLDAIRNVKRICDEALTGRYTLEIVDIYQQPHRAAADQVVAVPMLVKQTPLPLRRFIGTLSHSRHVWRAFGVMNTEVDVVKGPDRG
jgi:circadian clock protein KaiB